LAQYEHLPIYKAAFDLLLYMEKIVANFSRYNKYTHGSALRNLARDVTMLIVRAKADALQSLSSRVFPSCPLSGREFFRDVRQGCHVGD
jgi:hypothetical protein